MNDRIQRALDGELNREALSATELAELDEVSGLLNGVVRAVAIQPFPDQSAAVLRRIRASRAAKPATVPADSRRFSLARVLSWFWSPTGISISLRPAYALGIAVVLVAATVLSRSRGGLGEQRAVASANAAQTVLVQFHIDAPHASAVSLAGDFTNWAPTYTLQRSASGTWSIVVPLAPGVHDYSFVVDGSKWTPDPAAPARADGFGGMDSRIAVLASDGVKSL